MSAALGAPRRTTHCARGLASVFGSTLFQLSGVFMLAPLMLLRLKEAQISTTVAGLFAATTWLGILIVTPFASSITHRLGRRPTLWLATGTPLLAALGFFTTKALALWFALELMAGVAGGLRWVLAETFIAEFAPPHQIGRFVGLYATLVGATFVMGPALLAWVGAGSAVAQWLVLGLLAIGLAWTSFIPELPPHPGAQHARLGPRGLWQALHAQPVIMLAGFVGGFFELGLASVLPLYGLTLGLDANAAAALVAVSGLGGTLLAIPAGLMADRMASPALGRRVLMRAFTLAIVLVSLISPWAPGWSTLAWPMVFVWGAAGGALYTLAMTDIGATHKAMALVNSTAVLVLTYTLGGLVASGLCGALIDASVGSGFPALLLAVSSLALVALARQRPTPAQHPPGT
ncbi:MAG: MFS transporter [Rhodoferax sp.]